jgi:hypothetical protein
MENNIRTMEFIGIDDWNRPVYKCIETSTLWKDITLGSDKPELYNSCNNCFDGEPDCPIKSNLIIKYKNQYKENHNRFNYQMFSRLRRNGLVFTHEQEKAIKSLENAFREAKKVGLYAMGVNNSIHITEDIDICISVFGYALKIINNSMKNYIKQFCNNKHKTSGIKNDYISGFLKGLKDKFKEQITQNEQYALILMTPKIVLKEVEKRNFKQARSYTKVQISNNISAKVEGYKQGQVFGDTQKRKYITV